MQQIIVAKDLMIYEKSHEQPLEEFHLNLIHDILVCLDKG